MIDPDLLKILCCPETGQGLHFAEAGLIEELNQKIATGALTNRAGQTVRLPINAGLLREDAKYLYPIRDGIPVLLIDEAIPLADQPDAASDH